jgi:hypothetical protein
VAFVDDVVNNDLEVEFAMDVTVALLAKMDEDES